MKNENNLSEYGTDWSNLDLSGHERDLCLIDPLTFNALLLEIRCNLREINIATVTAQFESDMQSRIDEARTIFRDNLQNIIAQARKEREA